MSIEPQELLIISRHKVQNLNYGLSSQEQKTWNYYNIVPNLSFQTTKFLNWNWNTKVGVHQMALNKDAQAKSVILMWTKMGD